MSFLAQHSAWYYCVVSAFTLTEGIQIFIFPIFIGVSVITGLVWVRDNAPDKMGNLYFDSGVGLLTGALTGSRIIYVIFQWNYFKEHWIEIPQFQLGGYSWAGAVLGWMAAILIVSRLIHQPMLELSDAFIPLAGCLVIGVWLGCWFDGIAYGFLSDRWWALPAVDEWGGIGGRFPVQFIGSISTWLVMVSIDGLITHPEWKRRFLIPGKSTALFLSIFSLTLFILTFFRQDPAPIWMGYRMDHWISLLFFVLSVIMLGAIEIKLKITARKSSLVTSGF